MEDQHAALLLACVPCRRVVTIMAHPADLAAGRSSFDEHFPCAGCGKRMQPTERGPCGHVLLPKEDCACRS